MTTTAHMPKAKNKPPEKRHINQLLGVSQQDLDQRAAYLDRYLEKAQARFADLDEKQEALRQEAMAAAKDREACGAAGIAFGCGNSALTPPLPKYPTVAGRLEQISSYLATLERQTAEIDLSMFNGARELAPDRNPGSIDEVLDDVGERMARLCGQMGEMVKRVGGGPQVGTF